MGFQNYNPESLICEVIFSGREEKFIPNKEMF